MDGLINILKEPGLTSHDLVIQLRRLFNMQKVGHTGTLDPGAAGVLPVGIGQGTRVAEYMTEKQKSYRAEITLGITTDTADAGGRVLERRPVTGISKITIEEVLSRMQGEIEQFPPMYSAVHYQGKRLYQLAREGKTVERQARKVTIYQMELLDWWDEAPYPRLMLEITCSRGTYIRSIATEIGASLGCGAYLSFLVRTASGPFRLEDSYTLAEVRDLYHQGDYSYLLPIDYPLQDIPSLTVKDQAVANVMNGMLLAPSGITGGVGNNNLPQLVRLYAPDGCFLALGSWISQAGGGWLCKLKKVFKTMQDEKIV